MFKITEKIGSFIKKIKDAFVSVFKKEFPGKKIVITNRIKYLIKMVLYGSPEVKSLLSGKLRIDFGLEQSIANQVVFEIIEKVADSIEITPIYGGKNLVDISFNISPLALNQLLLIRNASYVSISKSEVQSNVPWLEWLLFRGTQVVVPGFAIAYGNYSKGYNSRTKEAIMVEINNPKKTRSKNSNYEPFRVDPEFAGTENDNFITRAIIPLQPVILTIIKEEIEK